MAAYTRCLRCAGAPRRPASGSGLSLRIPSWHAVLSDPGEFDIDNFQNSDIDIGLRRDLSGSALPQFPQSVPRGARISGLPGSRICYSLPSCSPPCTDPTGFPASGGFYFRASNETSPVAGYDYNSDWTPLLAGLAPAGMAASLAAPEPYVPDSGIRLPPWVSDGEARSGPRMEDAGYGEPIVHQLLHPLKCRCVLVAASRERTPPQVADMMAECRQCPIVGRHCVVVEVAGDDLRQPFPLDRDRLMHAPPQLLLDLLELGPHAVAPGVPFDLELVPACLAADEGEAQEVEGLRLAEPTPLAVFRRKASELDQPGLLGVKRQRKLFQSLAQRVQKAPGVALVLEADNEVVGIAHDDHVAGGLVPSPVVGPQVEHIVQVDVGEQR